MLPYSSRPRPASTTAFSHSHIGKQQKAAQPNFVAQLDGKDGQQLSDEGTAKALVAQRDALSPSGRLVLGYVKPLSASQ
jgi:hypothetical protein